jgi:hypothetical protein
MAAALDCDVLAGRVLIGDAAVRACSSVRLRLAAALPAGALR